MPDAGTIHSTALRIRAAGPGDGLEILRLWTELNRIHAELGDEWELAPDAGERFLRSVKAACGNPRMLFLVAEAGPEGPPILGFLQAAVKLRSPCFREPLVGEVAAICVAGEARGMGIGRALLSEAMAWFRVHDVAHVETLVAATNAPALGYWKAAGFRESAVLLRTDTALAPE